MGMRLSVRHPAEMEVQKIRRLIRKNWLERAELLDQLDTALEARRQAKAEKREFESQMRGMESHG